MKTGSCRYNIRIGYRHTSSRHPLLLHKTVNTDLYRLLKPLDELIVPISGQAYVRYPSVALGTCPILLLLTRLLNIMRRIVVNWPMLYVMIAEGYLIDDGYIET